MTVTSTDQRSRLRRARRRDPLGPDSALHSFRLVEFARTGRGGNNFDLLRLVAAAAVILAHSFDLLNVPEPFPHLTGLSWGTLGVLVFFSISGFLVTRSWDNTPRLGLFVLNRALRLMPGLIVALLLTALVLGPLVSSLPLHTYLNDPATKGYVFSNATLQSDWVLPGVFVHNVYPIAVNGSLWTLPLEVKAYTILLLCGLLGLAVRWRPVMIIVAVYAVVAVDNSWRSSLPGGNRFVALLFQIPSPKPIVTAAAAGSFTIYALLFGSFAVGATLYWLRRWIPANWPLAGIAVAICTGVSLLGGQAPELAFMIVTPYLVLVFAYRTTRMMRLPRRMGDYSYGVYVYGFPIQQTISHLTHVTSGWLMFVISLPLSLAAGALSWRFVESPALLLKRRLTGPAASAVQGPL
jgi:peptidoglycan/LPS O-acetylase OafA/YrhL